MTDIFADQIEKTIGLEGAYSNDANDAGGETRWGIKTSVARAHGYTGPMPVLPRDLAVSIYRESYVTGPKFDRLSEIDSRLGFRLFDIGVNCGPNFAGKLLQRALNVLNNQGSLYRDLTVDGDLGKMSRAALSDLYFRRGRQARDVLYFMVAALQAAHYIVLAEQNQSQEDFEWGWQINRAFEGLTVSV